MTPMPVKAPVTRAAPFESELLVLFCLVEFIVFSIPFPFILRLEVARACLAPRSCTRFQFLLFGSDRPAEAEPGHPLTIHKCPVCAAGIDQQDLIAFLFELG